MPLTIRMHRRHLHGSGLRSISALIFLKKLGSLEWCPLRVRKMARSRWAGRRRIPRRCKCQAKRAFARDFLNLLLKVGVILRNNKGDDKVEKPNGHPRITQSAYRDQCAASSQQRSIERQMKREHNVNVQ